jgi:uncharacterized protein (TIGR03437 family)
LFKLRFVPLLYVAASGCMAQTGWVDDFESYARGAFPSAWKYSGNNEIRVDDTVASGGRQSVRLFGRVGACWGALIHRQIQVKAPYTIEYAVRNGNETLSGCHPNRAGSGLSAAPDWSEPNNRPLGGFLRTGQYTVPGSLVVSGPFPDLSWVRIRISYQRPDPKTVRLIWWVNGKFHAMVDEPAPAGEDQRTWLTLTVDEGSVWYDDVRITTGVPADPLPPCAISLSPGVSQVSPAGGSVALTIAANRTDCPWSVSSDSSWAAVGQPASGTGSSTVKITVAPNDAGQKRTAVVRAGGATATIGQTRKTPWRPLPEALYFRHQNGGAAPAAQTLALWTDGTPLASTLTADSGGGSWLALQASSWTMPAAVSITVDPAKLAPGTYRGSITVKAPEGSPSEQTIPVALVVAAAEKYVLNSVVGWPDPGDGPVSGATRPINQPTAIAVNSSGTVFFVDGVGPYGILAKPRILKLVPDGNVSVIWKTESLIQLPSALAADDAGNVYVTFKYTDSVWKIDAASGKMTVLPQTSGINSGATGLAADPDGTLYFAANNRIQRRSPDGSIRTIAGGGTAEVADGTTATGANFGYGSIKCLASDGKGNLFIAGSYIFKLAQDGILRRVGRKFLSLGDSISADAIGNVYVASSSSVLRISADANETHLADSSFIGTGSGVAADTGGNIYVSDSAWDRIRRIAPNGEITSLVGGGPPFAIAPGAETYVRGLIDLTLDAEGRLYFTDGLPGIRRLLPDGTVEPFLGDGRASYAPTAIYPLFLSFCSDGGIYTSNSLGGICRIAPDKSVTCTGTGRKSPADGLPAAEVALPTHAAVTATPSGDLLVQETQNARVWRLTRDGILKLVAGTGRSFQRSPDGQPAATSPLYTVSAVAEDRVGRVFIAEGDRIRMIASDGTLQTVAGGKGGYAVKDGMPATSIGISSISGMTLDAAGNLLFSDRGQFVRIGQDGAVTVLDASKISGTEKDLGVPGRLAADTNGGIYYIDQAGQRIRSLRPESGACAPSLSAARMEMKREGGRVSIEVVAPAGCAWTVEGAGGGFTVSPGGSGAGTVVVEAPANDKPASRIALLLVGGQPLIVVQYGSTGPFEVSAAKAISAASFTPAAAPDSVISIQGVSLAVGSGSTTGAQSAVSLLGTSVEVNGVPAVMLSVFPDLVKCVVPTRTAPGDATVTVKIMGVPIAAGSIPVSLVAPALFTAGEATDEALASNAVTGKLGPFPVDTPENRGEDKRTRVLLLGTGLRYADGREPGRAAKDVAGNLRVEAADTAGEALSLTVETAVPVGNRPGFDGVVVILPPEAIRTKRVTLRILAGDLPSNSVTISIRQGL